MQFRSIFQNFLSSPTTATGGRVGGDFLVRQLLLRVIIIMAWTVLPSQVENRPKLRVLIQSKWEWPEMARNRCKPRKMTHSSETENFFGVM